MKHYNTTLSNVKVERNRAKLEVEWQRHNLVRFNYELKEREFLFNSIEMGWLPIKTLKPKLRWIK